MSIALDNNRIEHLSGSFMHRNKIPPCNLSILDPGDRTAVRAVMEEEREIEPSDSCSSSSSSSIGRNSDDEVGFDGEENEEVESKLNNTSFDSAVDALEQALPLRRGISKFYHGKSKSFATLADAASSPIKEITKPENAYTRKRKNLLAYSLLYDKGQTSMFKSPRFGGGIAKRSTNSSRNTLSPTFAIDEEGFSPETNRSNDSWAPYLSPLPPAPWRSFSFADLQHCGVSVSAVNSNLSSPLMGKRSKLDEVS